MACPLGIENARAHPSNVIAANTGHATVTDCTVNHNSKSAHKASTT
jgi:hypothetical protein